jgi:S1-C subfamily serine protease
VYWSQNQSIPEELLFPYPHPKSVGLVLASDERALIKSVTVKSAAADAQLQTGDRVLSMNGQPLLSMADVQWVLHQVPAAGGEVQMAVERAGKTLTTTLKLDKDWRRADDTSWRVAAWEMRRIATGGMRLVPLDEAQRRLRELQSGMALEVASVGMYGPHATAMNAGFQVGDIIVEFDGQTDFAKEADLFTHVNALRRIGDQVSVRLLRGDKSLVLQLPIQK